MSLKINITAEATNDAITVAELLAGRSSLNTSDKFLNATTQVYRLLAEMPGLGSRRDYGQSFSDLRMWHVPKFPKYLIFYRVTDTELTILRVLHGAQNIAQIFSGSEEG